MDELPRIAQWTVLVVLAIDLAMFAALIVLKTIHRRRKANRAQRRDQYIGLLSRGLVSDDPEYLIPESAADEEAFLEALIDLRNTVSGAEVDKLSSLASRMDLVSRQEAILRRPFFKVRRLRAAVSLAELGDNSSIPVLLEHLEDAEAEIRVQSARGLARIGYTPAIDRLLDRLEAEDDWVRARFGDSLASFGLEASQSLMAYVLINHAEGDTNAVVQAIRTLEVIGDYTIGPRLAQVLDLSSIPEVRISAAGALGAVGGSFAVPSLLDAIQSQDWRVRAKAATSLGEVGDRSIEADLVEALTDESWWVRRNAASALTRIPGSLNQLYLALTSLDPFARDAAAEALEDCGELSRVRVSYEEGKASRDELRLLRHMRGVRTMTG